MDLTAATLTLLLVMDPLGNMPLFLSALKAVPDERRTRVILRECLFALALLLLVFLGGGKFMALLNLTPEALRIAGGIVLFLIALRMIFPAEPQADTEHALDEPFVVPLATPYVAGPSVIATIILMTGQAEASRPAILAAIGMAWFICAATLLASPWLARILRRRGLMAVERLMGMLLVVISVQMFLDGLHLRR